LFSHLGLSLPSGLFRSDFSTKILNMPLSSSIRASCTARLILLHVITRTIVGEECRSLPSSIWSFLYSSVTSSLLGPNIPLFPYTLSIRSSLNYKNDPITGHQGPRRRVEV
jgi:hypothetical protein